MGVQVLVPGLADWDLKPMTPPGGPAVQDPLLFIYHRAHHRERMRQSNFGLKIVKVWAEMTCSVKLSGH